MFQRMFKSYAENISYRGFNSQINCGRKRNKKGVQKQENGSKRFVYKISPLSFYLSI